jgi:phosphohistidine swiveling domain-containing protein
MKPKLFEMLYLDAPLVFGELFTKCEGARRVPWSKDEVPEWPSCMAERRGKEVHFWYNQKVIDWKMTESMKISVEEFSEQTLPLFAKFKSILTEERALTRSEFSNLLDLVVPFWTWFDGVWWRIEYADKNKLDTSDMMKLRKETEYFVPGLRAVVRNSFRKILGESFEKYVDVLTIDEVLNDTCPSVDILEARLKQYVVIDQKLYGSINEVVEKYGIEFEKDDSNAVGGVMHGQCAFPGKAKGTVKIVRSRDDMKTFKEGDIIVSPTTTPDFVPVMKISAAIISEHGGVICHAAITSRELKIPCVVGVKGATKHLKDGDLVEVDAEKGIVKIIS